ncbi:class I SAM-dependent methyltransferase [Candidatus Daviesbacteria bacterium]|nr:class I SAM-dependent methyltransferase [Candidatus Daviesbacteria bacterium]
MKTVYQKLVEIHGFSNAQRKILGLVKGGEVLEVGSSSGYMTREFIKKGNVVDVIEVDKNAISSLVGLARKVVVGSVEDRNVQKKINTKYDFIICADVLEHLVYPEKVLIFLRNKLKREGRILISVPNIACWNMRVDLLRGKFDYQESGLLDKSHLRFYTYNSFLRMLKNCKVKVENIYPSEMKIPFEYSLLKLPILGNVLVNTLKPILVKLFPNLIIYHYVVQARV